MRRQPVVPAFPKNPAVTHLTQPAKSEIVIAAAGDIMMPSSIQAAIVKNGNDYALLFEKISRDLGADITFANLETPVDDKSPVSGYPKFNARPGLLRALKKCGLTIVSVANNHAMDTGVKGLKRTIHNLETSGLVFSGGGRTKPEAAEIKFFQARDVRVAFLSYTYSTNERLARKRERAPGVNIIGVDSEPDLNRAAASVRQARKNADIVVVSVHWGEEYATKPTNWQRRMAEVLVESGADVILGHHPHVLQPIESIPARDGRIALVAFSLGNFISSQNAGISSSNKKNQKALRGDGIVLYITAVKEGGRAKVDHAEFLPIWTLRERTRKGILCRPVSLAREIERLKAKINRGKEDENMLNLLTFRNDMIVKTVMAK